jgi:hypothetical protein
MNSQLQYPLLKRLLLPFCLFICLGQFCIQAYAQEKPPRPITVTVSTAQHLNFGTIVPISIAGGSVIVDFNGTPTPSGDILLLPSSVCRSALFIVDSEPGVLINIVYPDPIYLSNGGFSLQMHLGTPTIDSQPGAQFVTKAQSTYVYFGGTLIVRSLTNNPAGQYIGTFNVTFNQQ